MKEMSSGEDDNGPPVDTLFMTPLQKREKYKAERLAKVADLRQKKGATAAQTMEEIDSKGTNYARKMIPLIKRNEEAKPKEDNDDSYM